MLAIVAPENKYVSDLLDKFSYEKVEQKDSLNVYKVNYENHNFLILTTGYGKVCASSNLMYAINNYKINAIILIGTAGSINESCNIFDVIVPKLSLQFDVDFCPNGYEPGQIPLVDNSVYYTNDDLNACINEVCEDAKYNYFNDVIASSDMFVCNYRLSRSIKTEYDASFVDVESGTIGQFCYLNDIPYSCIKVTSNYANNNGLRQYNSYDDRASLIAQNIAYEFIIKFFE